MKKYMMCLIIALMLPLMINCARAEGGELKIGFAVKPVYPASHTGDMSGYYRLKLAPGQSETLIVEVYNRNSYDIEVSVAAVDAFTNSNGLIQYGEHESEALSFAGIARAEQSEITVPGQGRAEARFHISLPEDQPFDGEILGGLKITKVPEAETGEESGGVKIRNVYSYVITARVRQSDAAVEPELSWLSASCERYMGRSRINIALKNLAAVTMKEVDLSLVVYAADGSTALSLNKTVQIAPNSVLPYGAMLGAGEYLPPGEYRIAATLNYEGATWEFEDSFTAG